MCFWSKTGFDGCKQIYKNHQRPLNFTNDHKKKKKKSEKFLRIFFDVFVEKLDKIWC